MYGLPRARSEFTGLMTILSPRIAEAPHHGATRSRLPGDFLDEPTGTLIEIDELQHFTSARLASLDLYPNDIPSASI